MIYLDKYASFGRLNTLHPGIKILFFVLFVALGLISGSIVFSSGLGIYIAILTICNTPLRIFRYLRLLTIPMGFVMMGCLPILFEFEAPKAFFTITFFHTYGITWSSVAHALTLLTKSFSLICAMYWLILTTSIGQILYILGKCRVPALFIELMALVYRNIFVLFGTAQHIYISQKSRLGYTVGRPSYKSFATLLARTFALSLKKADDQWNSLEARGYSNQLNVIHPNFVAPSRYILLLASSFAMGSLACFITYIYGIR